MRSPFRDTGSFRGKRVSLRPGLRRRNRGSAPRRRWQASQAQNVRHPAVSPARPADRACTPWRRRERTPDRVAPEAASRGCPRFLSRFPILTAPDKCRFSRKVSPAPGATTNIGLSICLVTSLAVGFVVTLAGGRASCGAWIAVSVPGLRSTDGGADHAVTGRPAPNFTHSLGLPESLRRLPFLRTATCRKNGSSAEASAPHQAPSPAKTGIRKAVAALNPDPFFAEENSVQRLCASRRQYCAFTAFLLREGRMIDEQTPIGTQHPDDLFQNQFSLAPGRKVNFHFGTRRPVYSPLYDRP